MIGKKIRDIRQNKKLTLSTVAEAAGLTSSYISQLERELVEPSISSLRKLSTALQVPLFTFLDDTEKHATVIRVNQRKKIMLPKSSVVYEFLSPMTNSEFEPVALEIIQIKVAAKSWSRDDYSIHTNAEECIFVLEGALLIDLGEESYELFEGDSIYIRANIPHKAYNPGDTPSVAMLCITPPSY